MSEIVLTNRFLDIHPMADIEARGIGLLGVDVENVLTDYKNPEVLPGVAEHMEELLATSGLRVVLITNQKDSEFLDNVVAQLPGKLNYVNPNEELGLKKKPSPDMFEFAVREFSSEADVKQAAHVDDQFKAWLGATRAGYGTFFWTKPVGEHQHRGVKAFRPVEFGLIRPVISLTNKVRKLSLGDR